MSSTSSSISTADSCSVHYRCGLPARIRTSWTDDNPGRRFYGCSYWKRNEGGCGFFEWHDLPIEGRAKAVILSLMKNQGKLEDKIRELEKKLELVESRERVERVSQSHAPKPFGYYTVL